MHPDVPKKWGLVLDTRRGHRPPGSEETTQIFIVGCGRSGTTLLYELLCGHKDFAWFSNYTNRWPQTPQLAILSRLRQPFLSKVLSRLAPRPVEGYRIFDKCRPDDGLRPLTESDASEAESACLDRVIRQHLRYQHAARFVNKNTRNSRRIRYLNRIFPKARFVHVIRDPRATVASLLNVSWWANLPIWSHGGVTPHAWQSQGGDMTALAAEFWLAEVSRILEDATVLGASRYIEIHYEELTSEPESTIDKILGFARLPWTSQYHEFFSSFELTSRNAKVNTRLTGGQIETINHKTRDLASHLGY